MEKQLRTVVCPDHNLRYDPTVADGCVRCMRLLGTTGSGRTANPYAAAPAAPAATASGSGSKALPIIGLVVVLALLWLNSRVVRVKAPEGAFVDEENAFAIVVPPRWKTVDPSTVSYLNPIPQDKAPAVTLISDKGRLAPTIMIHVGKPLGQPDADDLKDFEEGFRKGFGGASLDFRAELSTVDRIRAVHGSAVAKLNAMQQVTLDQYVVPGRNRSYIINAIAAGEKREQTAEAARAIADGFRVLERPHPLPRVARGAVVTGLIGALIGVIRVLAKSSA